MIRRGKFPLKAFHTFGTDVFAQDLFRIQSIEEIPQILPRLKSFPFFILGGGSNLLFLNDFEGLILKNELKGKRIEEIDQDHVLVHVMAGENWHELVMWCVEKGLGGIENLALIPGSVGAAPIQNIGAYGVELRDTFFSLEAIHLQDGTQQVFSAQDCNFGYRDSYFKHAAKGKYLITQVTLKLTTTNHQLNTSYGAIQKQLDEQDIKEPTIKDIAETVIKIRETKLPDPQTIGNAGSFFKNPIVPKEQLKSIQANYAKVPHYPVDTAKVKLPAGWLIDQCGWKGKRIGDAGCYEKQALVLVNHGNAKGEEIWSLAQQIQASVKSKFNVHLEPEVNVIS
ncbi:MAG: UDP-N-acetylmuramate dehydrogenase [Bacteroidota bacterium]